MDNAVPINVRRERSKQLQILSTKKKRAFYQSQLNKTGTALLEAENHDGFMHGFTENYIKIQYPYNENLVNTFVNVEHKEIDGDGFMKIKELQKN